MLTHSRRTLLSQFTIGVDLGGTNLRCAAVQPDGEILEEFRVRTDPARGPDRVVDDIVAGIQEVNEGHKGHELIGIGIGVPALIVIETGTVKRAPNLPGFEDYPLRARMQEKLGLPVIVENDANAAALGEVWRGTGHDVDDLVMITLGTGVGGGIVYQGRIMHGFLGMAGEFGHITVEPNGLRCGCGNYGCLEAMSSATGIARMAEQAIYCRASPLLAEYKQQDGTVTPFHVHQAAQRGDAEAQEIYSRMGQWLGRGMAALVNSFNFPLYVIAGGVIGAWEFFAPAMFTELKRRSLTYRNSDTRIEKAQLGNLAGLYGAAYLPLLDRSST